MKFSINTAIAIKPDIVRFNMEMFNDEDGLVGEYQISEDISEYIHIQVDMSDSNNPKTNMEVDIAGIQQLLTNRIAEMQLTGFLADQLKGHEWVAVEPTEEVENEIEESSSVSE